MSSSAISFERARLYNQYPDIENDPARREAVEELIEEGEKVAPYASNFYRVVFYDKVAQFCVRLREVFGGTLLVDEKQLREELLTAKRRMIKTAEDYASSDETREKISNYYRSLKADVEDSIHWINRKMETPNRFMEQVNHAMGGEVQKIYGASVTGVVSQNFLLNRALQSSLEKKTEKLIPKVGKSVFWEEVSYGFANEFIRPSVDFSQVSSTGFEVKIDEEIVEELAMRYNRNLLGFLENLPSYAKLPHESLDRVLTRLLDGIEESSESSGFLYQITTKEGKRSYLIGTIHKIFPNMKLNTYMQNALELSRELLVEGGLSRSTLKRGCPRDFHIDCKLVKHALKNLIAISNVEPFDEHYYIDVCKYPVIEKIEQNAERAGFSLSRDGVSLEMFLHIEAWQKGDRQQVERVLDFDSYERCKRDERDLDNRNREWMYENQIGNSKGLVNKLQEDGPVCIAVGAGHLFGEKGLISLLEKEGFAVERVDTTPAPLKAVADAWVDDDISSGPI